MEKIANKEIPNEPGIYIFKDNYAEPLYVGKAKNLRKRVPSYFAKQTSKMNEKKESNHKKHKHYK